MISKVALSNSAVEHDWFPGVDLANAKTLWGRASDIQDFLERLTGFLLGDFEIRVDELNLLADLEQDGRTTCERFRRSWHFALGNSPVKVVFSIQLISNEHRRMSFGILHRNNGVEWFSLHLLQRIREPA